MKNLNLIVGVLVVLGVVGFLMSYQPGTAPSPSGQPEQTGTVPSPAPMSGKTTSTKTPNVVFAIKDKALPLEGIQSVLMRIKEISVSVPKKGWVPVITEPMTFDLIQLKKEGYVYPLSEIHLDAGTYTQIRFTIDTVLVSQNNIPKLAKLPSGELKILTNLVVEDRSVSAVIFDFLVDKSLHITGDNKYIFAPVINLKTLTGVQVQRPGTRLDIVGGVGKFTGDMGMNEAGIFGANISIDPFANLDVVNDIVVVMPKDTDRANLTISVETAIGAALNQKYADKVLSVKAETYFGRTVWRVLGTKNYGTVKVYVDGMIGEVIGVEYQSN